MLSYHRALEPAKRASRNPKRFTSLVTSIAILPVAPINADILVSYETAPLGIAKGGLKGGPPNAYYA